MTDMRAVRYNGHNGVSLEDVPVPDLRAGEVLVHPAWTGICGTDLHVSHGLHPRVRPPVTLGHEFMGTIHSSKSPHWHAGQRVVVEPLRTCGTCRECLGEHYNRCQQLEILGIDADGSLADLVAVPVSRLLELPDSVSDQVGALIEPVAVAAHAVATMGDLPEGPVLVFGGGPIGWLASVILGLQGHAVSVAETNPFRQDMIRQAGHSVFDVSDTTQAEGRYRAALEASGTGIGLTTLVDAVAPGGVISVVGLPKAANEVDAMKVISRELTIRGSRVYTRADFVEALALLERAGESFARLITHEIELGQVVEAGLARIEGGGAVGKIMVRGTA